MEHPKGVKILWLNPVGSSYMDEPVAEQIRIIKAPSTQADVVSYKMEGALDNLEFRTYEALITGHNVRMARYAAEEGYDALVMGCFYDTALEDMREISGEAVVVGPCQAGVQIAANLANRFSVLVGRTKWIEQMQSNVRSYGYEHMLASMRSIATPANELQASTCETTNRFVEVGRQAIEEDRAEALVLGCTCSFGMHEALQEELNVPVIDPIYAPFKVAEHLAIVKKQFGWKPSRQWSCAAPPEEALQAYRLFEAEPPIGNMVSA